MIGRDILIPSRYPFLNDFLGETVETVADFIFLGSKITADGDCSHEIKRKESYDQPRQHIKKQRHHFVIKDSSKQSYVVFVFCFFFFSSSHV